MLQPNTMFGNTVVFEIPFMHISINIIIILIENIRSTVFKKPIFCFSLYIISILYGEYIYVEYIYNFISIR